MSDTFKWLVSVLSAPEYRKAHKQNFEFIPSSHVFSAAKHDIKGYAKQK